MPCPRCDAPLLGTPERCPECGQALRSAVGPAQAQPFNPQQAVPRPQVPRPQIPQPQTPQAQVSQPQAPQAQVQRPQAPQAQATQPQQAPVAAPAQNPEPAIEPVPGLIDSRLFGAYVPQNLETETMPGLETTSFSELSLASIDDAPMLDIERFGEQQSLHANLVDDPSQEVPMPGLIDSRLFGAYVPAGVDAPPMEGMEQDRFDLDKPLRRKQPDGPTRPDGDDWVGFCPACGINLKMQRCPQCGNPALPFRNE